MCAALVLLHRIPVPYKLNFPLQPIHLLLQRMGLLRNTACNDWGLVPHSAIETRAADILLNAAVPSPPSEMNVDHWQAGWTVTQEQGNQITLYMIM